MSLDGLRAWIGLVERKLTMRTRVFLVLVALAIGAAGTGIYLALDARNDAVSESDLQNVREELAGGTVPSTGTDVDGLEAQIEALQSEVAELKADADQSSDSGTGSTPKSPSDGGGGTTGGGGASAPSGGAGVPKTQQQLEDLVEKAQQEAEAAK